MNFDISFDVYFIYGLFFLCGKAFLISVEIKHGGLSDLLMSCDYHRSDHRNSKASPIIHYVLNQQI